MRVKVNILLLPLLAFFLFQASSCDTATSDADLKKIAKSLVVIAQSVGLTQNTVIDAHSLQLIGTEEARSVLVLCKSINVAGIDAVRVTRDLSKLGATERVSLLGILGPVLQAVKNSQSALEIKNPDVREKVRIFLLTTESALNTILAVLAVSGS